MLFEAGKMTTARRLPPIGQLECMSNAETGECSLGVRLSWANCTNVGFDGRDVRWECESDADTERVELVDTLVSCEPYNDNEDSYSLAGSCGLKYLLKRVAEPQTMNLRFTFNLHFSTHNYSKPWFVAPMRQLRYVGSDDIITPSVLPREVRCRHRGVSSAGIVSWRCSAQLNPNVELSNTIVACEPGPDPDTPMIVMKDSCTLEYDLKVITPPGDGFLLKHHKSLTFDASVFTMSVRHPEPQAQLACNEPCAGLAEDRRPAIVECALTALDRGDLIVPTCTAPGLDSAFALFNVSLVCEGVYGGNDPFKIPQSCRLRYSLGPAGPDAVQPTATRTAARSIDTEMPSLDDLLSAAPDDVAAASASAEAEQAAFEDDGEAGDSLVTAFIEALYDLSASELALSLTPAAALLVFFGCCCLRPLKAWDKKIQANPAMRPKHD